MGGLVCLRTSPQNTLFCPLKHQVMGVSNIMLPLLVDHNFMSIPDTANALTPTQNDLSCP
jgi:hypothetical protein